MFSFIIPTYNVADYIDETLASILCQCEGFDIEVIVVDDGSTDQTGAIVKRIAAKHKFVSFLKNDSTKGVAGARNKGLKASSKEWIAFLDGDDVLCASAIIERVDAIQSNKGVDLISSAYINWYYLDESKTTSVRSDKDIVGFLEHSDDNSTSFVVKNTVATMLNYPKIAWTGVLIAKRELIAKAGFFNENLQVGEDRDLWLRLALESKKFVYIKNDLCKYRKRDGSLTRSGTPGSVWAAQSLQQMLQNPKFDRYKGLLNKKLADYELNNSYYFRKNKQFKKAVAAASRALRANLFSFKALKSYLLARLKR